MRARPQPFPQLSVSRSATLLIALPFLTGGCLNLESQMQDMMRAAIAIAVADVLQQHLAILHVADCVSDQTESEILNLAGTDCLVGPTFPFHPEELTRRPASYRLFGFAEHAATVQDGRMFIWPIDEGSFWNYICSARDEVWSGGINTSSVASRLVVCLGKGDPPAGDVIIISMTARRADKSANTIIVTFESVSRVAAHEVELVENLGPSRRPFALPPGRHGPALSAGVADN